MTSLKNDNLMKVGGVIAILATALAISDSASAINLTIGNTSIDNGLGTGAGGISTVGQSFINDPSATGTSVLLNDWTFALNESSQPLFSSATLNIYAGTGIGGTLIGSASTYDSVTLAGDNAAKWTFTGGLSLFADQTYTAAVITSGDLVFHVSTANPYANGFLTSTDLDITNIVGESYDTMFLANFSSAPTPVPFEFEPTGGLLVLGGGWLLRRHLKKKAKKD